MEYIIDVDVIFIVKIKKHDWQISDTFPKMGNQLVIPSQADWYEEPLRKMKISVNNCIDSGTFLLTLDCKNQNNQNFIVKAYEYTESLEKDNLVVDNSKQYFQHLTDKIQATQCILNYSTITVSDRYAFLMRPKMQYTLPQRLEEYPRLEEIEKRWVVFQIFSAIMSLHSISLVHGSLNPDNIFCDWNVRVNVGDMAPFKPTQIRADKANIYHHYFSTSTRNGCYLAPEQVYTDYFVLDALVFNNPTFSADLFAIGCIIYYLYTGTHLFSFSTLLQYKQGNFDVDSKLANIPESIRGFARILLDIDPNARLESQNLLHKYFPACFRQIFNQFLEFSTNDGSLSHFVTMIPVFYAMVDDQDVKVRVILTNLFSPFILTSDDLTSIIQFSYFLVEFAAPLSEEILLCRILPNIIGLLSIENYTIKTTGLRCIVKLLQSCKQVNQDLASIIQNYLLTEMTALSHKNNEHIRVALAENAPRIIREVIRLIPEATTYTQSIIHFIINETNPLVVQAFISGLKTCTEDGVKLLQSIFPILLSTFNHRAVTYKAGILQTFIEFWEKAETKADKEIMTSLLKNLAPAAIGFLQHEPNHEMRNHFLAFIDWYFQIGFMDRDLINDLFTTIGTFVDSKDPMTNYYVTNIINSLPENYKLVMLPSFILKSINSHATVPTLQEIADKPLENDEIVKYPLMTTKKIHLSPKFYMSTRVSQDPIKGIAALNDDTILALTTNNITVLSTNSVTEKPIKILGAYNSICALQPTQNVIVSDKTATYVLNVAETKIAQISKRGFHKVKMISTHTFIGSNGSNVAMYDVRMPNKVRSMVFDELKVGDIVRWPESPVIGVGFKEGVVEVVDMRTWRPSSMIVTPPVYSMAPQSASSCAVFVASKKNGCLVDFTSNSILGSLNAGGLTVEMNGRAVLAGDSGTFFIDPTCVFRLNENSVEGDRIIPLPSNGKIYDAGGWSHSATLHGHVARITALTRDRRLFSGDQCGFVNIWSVSD